jgi:hypothetical protein
MFDGRRDSLVLFSLITISGIGYYVLNNLYDSWAYDPGTNWFAAILVYYFLSQPLYLLVLYFFWRDFGWKGLIAGVIVMVSLDISSVPHSIPSLWPGQTTTIPSDPNLSPYADYQIARILAVHGVIGFPALIFLYIVLPTVLDLIAVLMVSPEEYQELVERS